jgi:branched-chain amino acid transport system ATP-binding protein
VILSVRDVTKRFGGLVANDGISFDVDDGALVAVIGPNGAGKTTLFNIIAGAQQPTLGAVRFAGHDIAGLAQHQVANRGLIRTFQLVQLFKFLTVAQNVSVGFHRVTKGSVASALFRRRWVRDQDSMIERKTRELLEFVGLDGLGEMLADHLPYGQQRLLELARALAAEPKLLLLDEPAAGLNVNETAALADVIERINQRGIAVLLVEHDMNLVMRIAQRIVVLDFGRKIAEGTPEEIKTDPAVLAAYLGGEETARA